MAYTDDWENLMNGVFGPGGKLRFDTQKTPPEKPGLPDMNAALLEQQKKLDEMLRKQNAELRRDTTQEALAQSRKMLEDMEADGLLAKGTTEVRQEHLGSFEGLAAEVKKTVLGQDSFLLVFSRIVFVGPPFISLAGALCRPSRIGRAVRWRCRCWPGPR